MNAAQIGELARQYALQYDLTERQAQLLVSNALGQDSSGKILVFALSLLSHEVDIEVVLKSMALGEAAWYRSAELVL
jgi:hypothetical protein